MSALRNNRGFTLIEFLVSVVILTIGLLGLLQTINFAITTNMANKMRDEATVLADETLSARIAALSTTDVTAFAIFNNNSSVSRKIFSGYKNYSVSRTETPINIGNSIEVNVLVSWKHKNTRYEHNASTVLSKR